MTLEKLYTIIKERQKTMPEDSYVASLFRKGEDRIIQKVGEEAVEVVIAAKNDDKQRCIEEISDLLFMLTVLLAVKNITYRDILARLERRRKK